MLAVKNDTLELGRKQAELFMTNNVVYCEILVTCSCPRHILVRAYQYLVLTNKIVALEDMLTSDQKAAGEIAKSFVNGRLERKELIEVVKALLAIEYFLNL